MKRKWIKLCMVCITLLGGILFAYASEDMESWRGGELEAATAPQYTYPQNLGDILFIGNYGGKVFAKDDTTLYLASDRYVDMSSYTPKFDNIQSDFPAFKSRYIASVQAFLNSGDSIASINITKEVVKKNGGKIPDISLITMDDINMAIQNAGCDQQFDDSFKLDGKSMNTKPMTCQTIPKHLTLLMFTLLDGEDPSKSDAKLVYHYYTVNSKQNSDGSYSGQLVVQQIAKNVYDKGVYGEKVIMKLPIVPDNANVTSITYTPNNEDHREGESTSAKNTVVGSISLAPDAVYPAPTLSVEQGNDKFTLNSKNEVVINVDDISAGDYTVTFKSVQGEGTDQVVVTSDPYTIAITEPYKKINDVIYTPDTGFTTLKLGNNTDAGQIGTFSVTYDTTGADSGRDTTYSLTNKKGSNDNAAFTLTADGKLSIKNDLTVAKTYVIEVTVDENENSGASIVSGTSYTKTFNLVVKDKDPAITDLTFTPAYPTGKTSWNYGDPGINAAGEITGSFTFAGGSSGSIDATTKKDYKTYEIVDATGNPINDTSFEIVDAQLKVKQQIAIGTHTLYIKLTDNNDQTYTKTITIVVGKAANPFTWNDTVKTTTSMYYGDTLDLGVENIGESATVTYGPAANISGTTFTAGKPTTKFTVSASAAETTSYGETDITHELAITSRPLTVQVQLKDDKGSWQNSVTIQKGQTLPEIQLIEDTSDATSKGLAASESSLTDAKFGTITYEYRKGNTVVADPANTPGTYSVWAVYTNNEYYSVKVNAGTLIVSPAITIDPSNKGQFYELQASDKSLIDPTKWQMEDVIIHPKHATYKNMKVDTGTYQSVDQTYAKEGTNTVSLVFKADNGAVTDTIQETLKIDKTDPTITDVTYAEKGGAVQVAGSGTFAYLFKHGADIKVSASDAQSGIASYKMIATPIHKDGSVDTTKQVIQENPVKSDANHTFTIQEQGMYEVEISVSDVAGRTTTKDKVKIKINANETTLQVNGYLNGDTTTPYDPSVYTNQSIDLILSASDQSELTDLQYSTDGKNFSPIANSTLTIANTSSIKNQTYYFKAINADGDEISTSIAIKLDVDQPSKPTITYTDEQQNILQQLLNSLSFDHIFTKKVKAEFSSDDVTSGIAYYEYTLKELDAEGKETNAAVISGQAESYAFSKNKNYKLSVIAYDQAGNASDPVSETIMVNTTQGELTLSATILGDDDRPYTTNWSNDEIHIKLTSSNPTGVSEYAYSSDGVNFIECDTSGICILPKSPQVNDKTYTFKATHHDQTSNQAFLNIRIDTEAPSDPTITVTEKNTSKLAQFIHTVSFGTFLQKEVDVEITGTDNFTPTGQIRYEYMEEKNGREGAWKTYTGKLTYEDGDNLRLHVRAVDLAGNDSENETIKEIYVDTTAPSISGVEDGKAYYVPRFVTYQDGSAGSGIDPEQTYFTNHMEVKKLNSGTMFRGVGTISLHVQDKAGNETEVSFMLEKKPSIADLDENDKDIVDQVEKEYEEVKDKLDEEERKEIEDWLKEAQDKVKPSTKTEVEEPIHDIIVEGENGTVFDVDVELVVEIITTQINVEEVKLEQVNGLDEEHEIKEAYDIYLKKGDEIIQPDGLVKVKIPYTEELKKIEDLKVVYIDNENYVSIYPHKIEGNYITFTTDHFSHYAIVGKIKDEITGKKDVNIDTDHDGLPDLNLDLNDDGVPELNIDTDFDNIPNIDIDTGNNRDGKEPGKADINIDLDGDGRADLNIAKVSVWTPDKNDCVYQEFHYDTMSNLTPILNVDDDGDGKPDRNIDDDGDGIPDRNIDPDWFDKYGDGNHKQDSLVNNANASTAGTGGVTTGDTTKWYIWWIALFITDGTMVYSHKKKKHMNRS